MFRYHNATGTVELTDPSGAEPKARVMYTAMYHDEIGRQLATADYGTNGGSALARPATGDQVTRYVYGTTLADSAVARRDLLRAEIYPDCDDTPDPLAHGPGGVYDRVEYRYNRQGEVVQRKDQNGTVHAYEYDLLGRRTADRVTAVGSCVDPAVRRISTTYEIRRMVEKVTSYDSPTVGAGSVLRKVAFEYDDTGRLVREYQEHAGAKDAATLSVAYTYDPSADAGQFTKGLHPTSVRYPNGRLVHFTYGPPNGTNDALDRLAAIHDDAGTPGQRLAEYSYLGLGMIVVEDYPQPQVKLDYTGEGSYRGFDRFGRIVDQRWIAYGQTPEAVVDRYAYQYDRAGNRTRRTNELHHAFDETYGYDALNRLVEWKLNGTTQKTWTLDALGNDLAAGSYNAANEATPTVGSSGYDAAGNMTMLQSGLTAKYDAWNRLVEVADGEAVTERYEYDGTGRRIQIFSDFDGGTPQKVVDNYLNGQQVVESDITIEGEPAGGFQHLWSPRYIDAPILRDTLSTDGTAIVAAERVFYLADANYNVTGLVKYDSGADEWQVAERYTYTSYGVVAYRNADWTTATSSAANNTILYTGRTLDLLAGLRYYRALLRCWVGKVYQS